MKRRFAVFILIFVSLLFVTWLYVGVRLASGAAQWIALSIPFVYTVVGMVFLRERLAKSESPLARAAVWANGLSMGWISFAFACVVARDLALGLPAFFGLVDPALAFGPASNLGVLAASFAALAWGIFGGLRPPRAQEIELAIEGLPETLDGFSIAHVTDLHVGSVIRERYARRVVELVNAMRANAVALTGDIVDGPSESLEAQAAPLADLLPKGRVFYVPGNHEYYWDAQAWFAKFETFGARLLLNNGTLVDGAWIGGVVDPAASMGTGGGPTAPDVSASIAGAGAAGLKVLLAHQPNVGAELAEAVGYHAQLSGHTHGGQFFPWTLAIRKAQRFHLGLFRVGRMQIYVNPGTGSWGPPLRLGTRTEIAKITFRRAAASPLDK